MGLSLIEEFHLDISNASNDDNACFSSEVDSVQHHHIASTKLGTLSVEQSGSSPHFDPTIQLS